MFDVELPIAWNTLTGQATQADTLWAYILINCGLHENKNPLWQGY
jgi:hypothetical protein